MNELILATSNSGKIRELQSILSSVRCISQHALGISDAEETGLSFIENAIIKARHASSFGHKPALADDSGLVVLALNGRPGIYSARFAGVRSTDQENIALLLKQLADTPDDSRQAYFYCAIALVQRADDPTPIIATGSCSGLISRDPQGDDGFGYDPVFYLPEYECTLAQLPEEIKNTVSHRAMALAQLRHVFLHSFSSHTIREWKN
ncbi:MAG: RdgB/HAM1 family non-canonical purine NTP pyrophosphatase [Legionellaceae bacterium]|nr:RdgB/HAM1 family non-canonical purine NTP pyrophosphatase [Legionellaceae bacterium]